MNILNLYFHYYLTFYKQVKELYNPDEYNLRKSQYN
jgi:hypothetical protein